MRCDGCHWNVDSLLNIAGSVAVPGEAAEAYDLDLCVMCIDEVRAAYERGSQRGVELGFPARPPFPMPATPRKTESLN